MLERPLRRGAPRRLGAAQAPGRVEQLRQARRQPLVVVRVGDDVPLLRRVQQFAGAVVARRDDRQAARHRLQHHVGTGVVERRVDQEVGGEVGVAHVAAVAGEADAVGDAEPARQPLPLRRLRAADHQQHKRPVAPDALHRVQQRLQPLQAIIHPRKERDGIVRRRPDLLAPLHAAPRPVAGLEALRVGRQPHQPQVAPVQAEILPEVRAHHVADGDDERPRLNQILAPLQQAERRVGRVEHLEHAQGVAQQAAFVLEEVVLGRGDVEAALRVEHVEAGELVEADGDLVPAGG